MGKITANQIRTGNYFLYDLRENQEGSGTAWEPTKLDWQDIKWCEENNEDFNRVHMPIPINEEWAKKLGYKYYNGKTDGDMTMDFGGKLDIDFVKGVIKVKSHYETELMYRTLHAVEFVHEIQNLYFALTGIELVVGAGQEKV